MGRTFSYDKIPVPDLTGFQFKNVFDLREVSLHGFYKPYELRKFVRLPDDVAEATSEGVSILRWQTAGGRIRFSTDAATVAVRFIQNYVGMMAHMPLQGSSGIDVYVKRTGEMREKFFKILRPQIDPELDCAHILELGEGHKDVTLCMPLYNSVEYVELGLRDADTLSPATPYLDIKPIVYYGSSITQGGCASRPGLCYQARIARKTNIDYMNLGFSGSAKGEDSIVNYMSGLDMSMFVSDYDHNAPDPEHLEKTHEKLYKAVREKHPDIPYIIVGKPDFYSYNNSFRREVIFKTYANALKSGDKHVYYIDSYALFSGEGRDECTVDGCHPNDIGFERMANVIGSVISEALGL